MIRAVLVAAALLPPAAASAQLRPFSCVGAERLEGDVVTLSFDRGKADFEPHIGLAELARRAKEEPSRNICVIGTARPDEGGAQTAARLAARRAREVATELARLGVERDRVRAEARTRAFATSGPDRRAGARAVLLPE